MKKHLLKTWPVYFDLLWNDRKNCEIRFDDRGFSVGDALDLREWDPSEKQYTGRYVGALVTHIFHNIPGLQRGYCLLIMEIVTKEDDPNYREDVPA